MVQCFKGGNIMYQVNAGLSSWWAKGEQFQCSSSTDLSINISIFFLFIAQQPIRAIFDKSAKRMTKNMGKILLHFAFLQINLCLLLHTQHLHTIMLANLNQTCECQNNFAFINYLCKGQVVSPCTIQPIIQLQIAMIYFPIISTTAYTITLFFKRLIDQLTVRKIIIFQYCLPTYFSGKNKLMYLLYNKS